MESLFLSRRKNLAAIAYLLGGAGFAAAQGQKYGGQPEMHAALDHLRQAKDNLVKAKSDNAGHRARALELVDKAIFEVDAVIVK